MVVAFLRRKPPGLWVVVAVRVSAVAAGGEGVHAELGCEFLPVFRGEALLHHQDVAVGHFKFEETLGHFFPEAGKAYFHSRGSKVKDSGSAMTSLRKSGCAGFSR